MSRNLRHWLSARIHRLIHTARRHPCFFLTVWLQLQCKMENVENVTTVLPQTHSVAGWWGFEQTRLLRGLINDSSAGWLGNKTDKKLKAMPGVLPLANGAGHMLYRLIVLLHSLLVTLFLRQRRNQNNPNQSEVCLQFSRRKERVAEISRFHLVPHSLFKHPIKWKLNWQNGSDSINLITRKTGH